MINYRTAHTEKEENPNDVNYIKHFEDMLYIPHIETKKL